MRNEYSANQALQESAAEAKKDRAVADMHERRRRAKVQQEKDRIAQSNGKLVHALTITLVWIIAVAGMYWAFIQFMKITGVS